MNFAERIEQAHKTYKDRQQNIVDGILDKIEKHVARYGKTTYYVTEEVDVCELQEKLKGVAVIRYKDKTDFRGEPYGQTPMVEFIS